MVAPHMLLQHQAEALGGSLAVGSWHSHRKGQACNPVGQPHDSVASSPLALSIFQLLDRSQRDTNMLDTAVKGTKLKLLK